MRVREAIVLVGGLGTRLRGVVDDLPKPLAPVAGRSFLSYVLDQLAAGGITRVILATGYLSGKVESAIGTHWRDMEISYSIEDKALGTGGAIALAARALRGDCAHVANGDTLLRFDLSGLEASVARMDAWMGMALAQVPDVARYGAVDVLDDRARAFIEKGAVGPGLINAGSYFLTRDAIEALPGKEVFSFETEVLLPLAERGRVAVFAETADFIDIGVPEDFWRANMQMDASR